MIPKSDEIVNNLLAHCEGIKGFDDYVKTLKHTALTLESTDDPDDPEAVFKSLFPTWRILSHIRNHHFYFIDGYGRVAVADYSMADQRDPATAEDGLLLLVKEKPITKFKLHHLGDYYYSIPVKQGHTNKDFSISANPTEFADLWPKLEPLGFKVALREAEEDDDLVDPETYFKSTFAWMDTFLKAGMQPDPSTTSPGHFWKKYQCHGCHYNVYVRVRAPMWMIVARTNGYGEELFNRVFEYPDDYTSGIVQDFLAVDRALTKARTDAWDRLREFDEQIKEIHTQHLGSRRKWLNGEIRENVNIPPEDEPSANLDSTFDIKRILRGYEWNPVNNNWLKELRFEWPRSSMEISVRRRGHATEDSADTLYDIDILKGDNQGSFTHIFTAYSIKLVELAQAVKLAEQAVHTGNYALLDDYSLTNDKRFRNESVDIPPEDEPEDFVKRFLNTDLGARFHIIKSGDASVYADQPFEHDWIVYSNDENLFDDEVKTRTFEGYLRVTRPRDPTEYCQWQAFPGPACKKVRPGKRLKTALPQLYQSAEQAAYALYRFNRQTQEALDIPPEDEPEDVIRSHNQGLFTPELKRLGFKLGRDQEDVDLFGEKVPRYWYKTYQAADDKTHAIYLYLMHVLSGGPPDIKFNVYDEDNKQWWPQNKGEINLHPQTAAQAAACLRDVDAAMARSSASSLPPEQEWEMIQSVVSHYSKWYWDALYPPGTHILNVNPEQ